MHTVIDIACPDLSSAILDLFQGVCIGLSEVMASAGKHQLLDFMDLLIPTIRTALCDRFVLSLVFSVDSITDSKHIQHA